jgi:L-asparagine oxygenase
MSGRLGLSAFPPHTDVAHWPLPARYLLLHCVSNPSNIPTVLVDSKFLLPPDAELTDWMRAVWRINAVPVPFLCSAVQERRGNRIIRWDSCCMEPDGKLAKRVHDRIMERAESALKHAIHIDWSERCGTVIIDNWRMLHARPNVPPAGGIRMLQRILLAE